MDQMDLFVWADSRPRAKVIGITRYILDRLKPYDERYDEPAKLIPFTAAPTESRVVTGS